MVAFQAVDPGSIPRRRTCIFFLFLYVNIYRVRFACFKLKIFLLRQLQEPCFIGGFALCCSMPFRETFDGKKPCIRQLYNIKCGSRGRGSELHRPVSMMDHHRSVKLEEIKVDYSSTLA